MDIADCYRLLELNSTANLDELKTSYRRLARQLHPDVNPGNQRAHEQFIQVTRAYKYLLKVLLEKPIGRSQTSFPPTTSSSPTPRSSSADTKVSVRKQTKSPSPPYPNQSPQHTKSAQTTRRVQNKTRSPNKNRSQSQVTAQVNVKPPQPSSTVGSASSVLNQKLKRESYQQLQDLIKHKRFPRAIALVEALAQRLPQDQEVRQWQGIIYQRWGRQLIQERKPEQARAYLKKSLSTDPHNKSLWAEVERDFRQLEKIF